MLGSVVHWGCNVYRSSTAGGGTGKGTLRARAHARPRKRINCKCTNARFQEGGGRLFMRHSGRSVPHAVAESELYHLAVFTDDALDNGKNEVLERRATYVSGELLNIDAPLAKRFLQEQRRGAEHELFI